MMAFKKSIAYLPVLFMFIVLLIAAMAVNLSAAEVTVNIESFTRGAQSDLRSSELLEAKVEGYDGNVRELTYKWTSTLGTYLYVYNSHNMYGINNTDGEIEIYNNSVSASSNMSGRSYKDSFTGVGYAWAAVYGADVSSANLVGTVTVSVYDVDGTLLATDSHEGTRSVTGLNWFRPTYTNYGFVASSLDDDVSNVSFGLFEGDTKNVKILLGESSIVHITCEECTVSQAEIVEGSDIVEVVFDSSTQEYHIKSVTGVEHGYAEVRVTVKKGNCKFHKNYSTTRVISVYVYKKPTTTSTATAIMLDNLDDDCTYYIGGAKGERGYDENGKEIVIFEGLTPNTQYQVEVVGQADNTDPVYAYVYETTKPAHVGTVEVILNGTYDTSTGTAFGERVDISSVMPGVDTLYLRYEDSEIYFELENTETGVYSSVLSNGNYTIYSAKSPDAKISDQILTISDASRTRELFFNSVTYDVAGGVPEIDEEYYLGDSAVTVTETVPNKEGYLFTHWTDDDGNEYKSGAKLTDDIGKAYTLTANYVEANDVYVNITIKHICADGDNHNNDNGMHDIVFTVDQRLASSGDYTELVSRTVDWDGVSEYTGSDFNAEYIYKEEDGVRRDRTVYTAKAPILVNVEKNAEYTFTTTKSGYDLANVTSELDENGDWQIYAELIFNPNDFDLAFTVELDSESMLVADELKPAAVNVKVISWGDSPFDDSDVVLWTVISQHKDTYERIALDENGKGRGTYPVWMSTTDTNTPYSYRIEVVSYETADGTVIPAIDKNNEHIIYATEKNRYSTEIFVDGGNVPSGSTLSGAYYDGSAQAGTINAVVSIEVFDITFDPNGGSLFGTTDNTVLNYQIGIPSLDGYIPTRDGGYVFDGWYIADVNGNMTAEKAVSDTIVFADTTLIAKWKEPLTIAGTVSVAGTYVTDEGIKIDIYDHDRIKNVTVLLQRIDANGYAETVAYKVVPVAYSGDYGIGTYEFAEIRDENHDFRIKVVSANYHTHYLNETSDAAVTDYDSYAEEIEADMYMAAFEGDFTADVNVYLHFMPTSFELKYEIDASYIGEGFRPDSAEVLILCDTGEHIDPQHWDVISQMVHNGVHVGNKNNLNGGKGGGHEPVWNIKPDGGTPYHYSMKVNSLVMGGKEVQYTHDLPFAIYYNGSARFSDITGEQTQMLTATIVPRMYTITFDMGNLKEGTIVENMVEYATTDKTFEDDYYWSYGREIIAAPEAEGYTFIGWFDADGNPVSEISADSAENVTVYAKWSADIEFEFMVDAGYYSETRDSAEKDGIIAISARIANIGVAKNTIDSFGIYVYDATGVTTKISALCADMAQLEASNGEFHITLTDIAVGDFDKSVLAMPYVVVNGEIIMGTPLTVNVSGINKWLGAKSE